MLDSQIENNKETYHLGTALELLLAADFLVRECASLYQEPACQAKPKKEYITLNALSIAKKWFELRMNLKLKSKINLLTLSRELLAKSAEKEKLHIQVWSTSFTLNWKIGT